MLGWVEVGGVGRIGLEKDGIFCSKESMSFVLYMRALSCWNKGFPRNGNARMSSRTGRSQLHRDFGRHGW